MKHRDHLLRLAEQHHDGAIDSIAFLVAVDQILARVEYETVFGVDSPVLERKHHMGIDIRKLCRLVVNFAALAAAVLMLPEFGAVVSVEWLPTIAATAAIINQILSWIRAITEGVPFLAKERF